VQFVALGSCLLGIGACPARAEPFHYPVDVVAAEDGTIYVADLRLPGIWKVAGGHAEVFVQGGKTFRTPLNAIRCLALDADGRLLAGDSATREVYRVSAAEELTPLTGGAVGIPVCLAVGPEGDIFASDLELQRIWKIPAAGGEPDEFAVLAAVRGMAFDPAGTLWVARGLAPSIARVRGDGSLDPVVEEQTFLFTNQMAIGDDGTIYVADGYAKAIWKVSPRGTAERWIEGEPLVNPVGLAWRGDELLIVDPRANAIFGAAPDGTLSRVFPEK
jgi:sugar lactone lactonase YvrE